MKGLENFDDEDDSDSDSNTSSVTSTSNSQSEGVFVGTDTNLRIKQSRTTNLGTVAEQISLSHTIVDGIYSKSTLTLQFSKRMEPSSLVRALSVSSESNRVTFSAIDESVPQFIFTFTPTKLLDSGKKYDILISTLAKDNDGNALESSIESSIITPVFNFNNN